MLFGRSTTPEELAAEEARTAEKQAEKALQEPPPPPPPAAHLELSIAKERPQRLVSYWVTL
jgi:hypothetical protein